MKRLAQVLLFGTVLSVALISVLSAAGSSSKSSAAIPAFTAAQLSLPAGANWVMENGNLQSHRYSSLTQINGSNGGSLKLAWTTHLAAPTTPEQQTAGKANPIVYNGVMYVQDAWTRITALDASSGKALWQFDPQVGLNVPLGGSANSIGMGDGMIFTGSYGTVYALNAQTGAQVWASQIVNPLAGGGIDVSPVYYKGLILIGTTGGDAGGACIEVGLDAKTGTVKWHYSNIPSNPQAAGWNTWPATRYYYGGGAVWDMLSVDPKYDLVYAGTGNPLPFNGLINGPGAEVGTESVYAIHALTGKFAWVYQEIHHDIWDYDSMQTPLVETLTINGQKRDAVVHINKNAYYFVLDAQTGKPLISAPETPVPQSAAAHTYPTQPIPQNTSQELVPHVVQHPEDWQGANLAPDGKPYAITTTPYQPYTDQQYLVFSPTFLGGVEWPDPSFDPSTGLEYVCTNIQSIAISSPPAADQHPVINNAGAVIQLNVASVPTSYSVSRLVAFNPATNSIAWKHDDLSTGGLTAGHSTGCDSLVTTTGSGLVLIGRVTATPAAPNGDATIQAYDAHTGGLLWQIPVLVNGKHVATVPWISLYSIGGKEYLVAFTNFSTAGPDISAYTLP